MQEIASTIQAELDKRHVSYDEALTLGNIIQHRADQFVDDDTIVAISDRDAYRRTLNLPKRCNIEQNRTTSLMKSAVDLASVTEITSAC